MKGIMQGVTNVLLQNKTSENIKTEYSKRRVFSLIFEYYIIFYTWKRYTQKKMQKQEENDYAEGETITSSDSDSDESEEEDDEEEYDDYDSERNGSYDSEEYDRNGSDTSRERDGSYSSDRDKEKNSANSH